jgi:putative transposase
MAARGSITAFSSSPGSGGLPSAGPVRWSRPLEGALKTVTLSREADGWYVCFSCADVPVSPLPETGREAGVDLGIEAFATLSNGTRIFHPGWYRKAERALKTAQRRVSHRKKGSNRRRDAVKLLAKAHQKVRRQRQDFHHETALALVYTNDVIYHEDVRAGQARRGAVAWAAAQNRVSPRGVSRQR